MIVFKPWELGYKNPQGGVATKSKIHFRLDVDTSLGAIEVDWVVRKDHAHIQKKHPMKKRDEKNGHVIYTLDISIDQAGLYFYRFEIKKEDKLLFCGKDHDTHQAIIGDWLPEWQLTVYDKDFQTPDWLKGGVMYQIFVDRFHQGGKEPTKEVLKDRVYRKDWGGVPAYERDDKGHLPTADFFGGNLEGIIEKLDYLRSLGVTCLYLNPIFEAYTNHKYDTGDYKKVDPMFGDEETLERLCQKAKEKNIHILLDGVFSHTGSDSIYFNKKGTYDSVGAYQSKDSPYYPWYTFKKWPDQYDSWWGVDILPAVDETHPGFLAYINGQNGVLSYWMDKGIMGWRLDVADELPDVFLDQLRKSVKQKNSQGVIIGEVWEDASHKTSYGKRRRYLLGDQLDSVMNYPFQNAILGFVKRGSAKRFQIKINTLLEHYPKPAVDLLMNSLGTHDTQRVLTLLSDVDKETMDLKTRATFTLNKDQYEKAKNRLKLAALIQFTLPGIPCIYYGDEAGMEGFEDPLNRGCYPWDDQDTVLLAWYKGLGKIRNRYQKDFTLPLHFHYAHQGVLIYHRGERIWVVANGSEKAKTYSLPVGSYVDLFTGKTISSKDQIPPKSGLILLRT